MIKVARHSTALQALEALQRTIGVEHGVHALRKRAIAHVIKTGQAYPIPKVMQ